MNGSFQEDGTHFGTQMVNICEWMEEQKVWMTASPGRERTESPELRPLRTSLGTATPKKAGLVPPGQQVAPVPVGLSQWPPPWPVLVSHLRAEASTGPGRGGRGDACSLLRNRWFPRGCPANSAGKGVGGPWLEGLRHRPWSGGRLTVSWGPEMRGSSINESKAEI